ncbi:MAG: hypothetical protein JW759_01750 [Candidatus Coatesbacteria bacterium]|nr:hypothetical protein [Candidatus Coatesbacteria bacterium]
MTEDRRRDSLPRDDESVAEGSVIEEEAESDSASFKLLDSESEGASGISADEIVRQLAMSDASEVKPGPHVSGLAGPAVEHPAVLDTFSEVERRIKVLVNEKRQLMSERDVLHEQLEEARRRIAGYDEKVSGLLLIEEKFKSSRDQQEMVRTKVENLLSLLETEED